MDARHYLLYINNIPQTGGQTSFVMAPYTISVQTLPIKNYHDEPGPKAHSEALE
jgi:hypothetical protein